MVKVLLLGFDDRGKIKLSMKRVNQETGEILPAKEKPARESREDRESA
jgi:polyribonucleotide nucleotidyltransferase